MSSSLADIKNKIFQKNEVTVPSLHFWNLMWLLPKPPFNRMAPPFKIHLNLIALQMVFHINLETLNTK